MEIFYTVLMTLNISCAFIIFMSGIRQQKNYLVSLALLNIVVFFFHYYSWQFHTANSLTEAVTLSRIHSYFAILFLPFMLFSFASWCKFKYVNHLTLAFSLYALIFCIINYFSDYSIRYGQGAELITYTSIFGDQLVILKGQSQSVFHFATFMLTFTSGLLVLFSTRLLHQQNKILSFYLFIFLCLQIFIGYANFKLDNLEWPIFYLGGVPFTILSLFCTTLISSLYKTKSKQLVIQRAQQVKLEKAITKLAHGLSTIGSHEFYAELAKIIYDFTQADIVLIGNAKQKENLKIKTLAVLENGSLIDNFAYAIKDNLCAAVFMRKDILHSNDNLYVFPKDKVANNEIMNTYLGTPILNQDNEPIGIIYITYKKPTKISSSLIDALKIFASRAASEIKRDELDKRLKFMAYYDYHSKLPNREKLLQALNERYFECKATKSNALFMLIDLDHLGDINRQFGHDVGDQVIRQLGLRLQHYSSKNIFIARNSGDEFAFIISDVTGEITSLLNVQWQAIKAIINEPCIIGERKINISCSMGAVLFPMQIDNRFDIITSAEHSIQRAKENGRNQHYLFEPDLLAKIDRKKEIEAALAEAISSNQQLTIAYQPKVTKDGHVIGSEALLRWTHPQKGMISPAEFIPIAEESGLIHNLGKWVVNEVCRQLKAWIDQQKPIYKVSINVAASQFDDPLFIAFIFSCIEKHQLNAHHIEVELTESALLTDVKTAISNLSQLRDYGISIALDDFGTGFSSLAYLQDLPLDVLKIDKSFVDNIAQTRSAELIRSIISICNHMNFITVAEGTESIDQVDALVEMGCDYFQGYYFSRPLLAKDFMAYCLTLEGASE